MGGGWGGVQRGKGEDRGGEGTEGGRGEKEEGTNIPWKFHRYIRKCVVVWGYCGA